MGVLALIFAVGLTASAGQQAPRAISTDEVRQMQVAKQPLLLIDCRAYANYQLSHIADAVSIPLFEIGFKPLPKNKDLVLYCSEEKCNLSARAARKLVGLGYERVFVMTGGLAAWEKQGYPVAVANARQEAPKEHD